MWLRDRFHGEGSYYYGRGDVYSGAWVDGVKEGHGTFLRAGDESQLVGTWHKGSFTAGRWVWKDGTVWQGPFKDGKPT